MQIIHRISFQSSRPIRKELAALGRIVPAAGDVTFEIEEGDSSWPAIREWISKRDAFDYISTRFLPREIEEARWLELIPDWHRGYPEPNPDSFGFLKVTYDLSDYCNNCGIGLKQKGPFQMKSEPKWGRNGILQLNWVFDEFFVTPSVWRTVFEPFRIGCRPVTNKKNIELESVVQLVTQEELDVKIDKLEPEACGTCARVKYNWPRRIGFPALVTEPSRHLIKTRQYFGSEAAAHKSIIISQQLGRTLREANVRGASMKPVSPGDRA